MNKLFTFAVLCGLLAAATSIPTKQSDTRAPALPCSLEQCKLPDCLCSAQTTPVPIGGSPIQGVNVPQIVLLTFDDAITTSNYPFYEEVFGDRINPNGAPVTATFFVTHEYTNYSMVHNLWQKGIGIYGHDIALHSITHTSNTTYWLNLNVNQWKNEIIDQRDQIAHFAAIPKVDVKGIRAPFLQMGGNEMYQALSEGGMEWDCSRPTQNFRVPGLWPYTNDYRSTQDCSIPRCPTDAFPGFWTVPMIDLLGTDMFPCAMVDECTPVPMTETATFELLKKNFHDHYDNTFRAPFGVFTHAAWMVGDSDRPEFAERTKGYVKFLDYIQNLNNDVFIVGVTQALEWVKNPTGMADIMDFAPWRNPQRTKGCEFPRNCRYNNGTWERFMSSCVPCPPNYPWLNDHLGVNFVLEETKLY